MFNLKLKFSTTVFVILLFFSLFTHINKKPAAYADSSANNDYPPTYIYKISLGDRFPPFELTDLENIVWTNKVMMTRPVLFITGNWRLRHDVRLWADFLAMKFNSVADIIWLFNPSSTEFANQYKKNIEAFKETRLPVAVVIDKHSIIGRSLKIDYKIPTIIGITRQNRLAFTYASPLNSVAEKEIFHLVQTRLLD